jgi:hypothetical protein
MQKIQGLAARFHVPISMNTLETTPLWGGTDRVPRLQTGQDLSRHKKPVGACPKCGMNRTSFKSPVRFFAPISIT